MKKNNLKIVFFIIALVISLTHLMAYNVSAKDWGLGFHKKEEQPTGNESAEYLKKYDAYFIGDGKEKVLYLTFDAGYENGYTEGMLDVLKKHNAPATFFLVGNYIKDNPDIVKRMINEGHIVGNHTMKHPDMSKITSVDDFNKELTQVEEIYQSVTGQPIKKFYRPPQGKYNEENLKMVQQLGYKTFFWSAAYKDYDDNNQPSKEEAFSKLMSRLHPESIVLLHNTSKTNSEILDELLTRYKEKGYSFKSLEEF